MYGAMVALTFLMSAALALQFGAWLWVASPRLLVVVVAVSAIAVGSYTTFKNWKK